MNGSENNLYFHVSLMTSQSVLCHWHSLPSLRVIAFFFFFNILLQQLNFSAFFCYTTYFYSCDFNLYSPPKILNIKPKKKISALKKLNLNCCCSFPKSFFLILCDTMDYSTPGLPVLHYFPEFTQTHAHWVIDATQYHPLSPPSPQFFSSIGVFFNESALHIRLLKYWTFNFSISPSNEIFRIDFF